MERADDIAMIRADGGGDGVLWIHGYTLNAGIWAELWRLLPGWRHIGIDLPGHGRSAPLAPGETLRGLARRLNRLAAEQGVRHLVALSFGGMIALQMAIEAHVREEEGRAFPLLREQMGAELQTIGDEVARRKQQLTTAS